MSNKFLATLLIVLIITACAPTAPAFAPTSTPPPATSGPLDQMVDVGGYKLRIICTGQGTPTVVVDAGYAEPAVESDDWTAVRSEIEKTTRICVYDRAGLGSSDAAPTQPRTSQDIAKDLHTLLVNANVPSPYILVGHNFGGYNVRLYASQYPDEVVGMVLVDASHPDMVSKTLAVFPPESPDEPDSLTAAREFLTNQMHNTSNLESIDIFASADLVRATNGLGALPLVVLSHRPSWRGENPYFPMDVAAKMEQVFQDLQIDLAGLSSNSTHVIATKAGPDIQVDEPQLVIDAILRVVNEAKK